MSGAFAWAVEPVMWAAALGAAIFFALEYVVWSRKPRIHREDRDLHYYAGCLVYILVAMALSGFLTLYANFGVLAGFYLGFSGPPAAVGIATRFKPSHLQSDADQ